MPFAALVLASSVFTSPVIEPPAPESRYYFILFGGQSVPFRARTAHTWATYVKTTPAATGGVFLEVLTISWLPETVVVRPLAVRPVAGRNWTLEESLEIAASQNNHISVWGPYEIDEHRWQLAQEQAALLGSGAIQFRAIDSFNLNRHVINCVHAVTHASPVVRDRIQPVIRVGEPGTSRLAKLYLRGGAWPGYPEKHLWLLPALGIDRYPNLTLREPGEFIPRRWQ